MKRINLIGKSVALGMCLIVSSAQAGGVACAVDEVLQNSKESTINFNNQSITIEPVKVVDKRKGAYTLMGSLRVAGKAAPGASHEIAYRVTKEKGAVKTIEMQTDGGAWQPISAEMMRALGDFTKTEPISEKRQQEAHTAMYQAAKDGSWQKSAELIIAFMAIRHC